MMRKKNQRHAKEKEEKHKKESEAMALKRKFEASKMLATKTRIPVARHHLNDREVSEAFLEIYNLLSVFNFVTCS